MITQQKKVKKDKVFISYSHEDREIAERLIAHLREIDAKGLLEFWSDREIVLGDNLSEKIANNLEESKLIVILVSPDYTNSQFCNLELLKTKLINTQVKTLLLLIKPIDLSKDVWLQQHKFYNSVALANLPVREQEEYIIDFAKEIKKNVSASKKDSSNQILSSSIGGPVIGTILFPGIGTVLGGVTGAAAGAAVAKKYAGNDG